MLVKELKEEVKALITNLFLGIVKLKSKDTPINELNGLDLKITYGVENFKKIYINSYGTLRFTTETRTYSLMDFGLEFLLLLCENLQNWKSTLINKPELYEFKNEFVQNSFKNWLNIKIKETKFGLGLFEGIQHFDCQEFLDLTNLKIKENLDNYSVIIRIEEND